MRLLFLCCAAALLFANAQVGADEGGSVENAAIAEGVENEESVEVRILSETMSLDAANRACGGGTKYHQADSAGNAFLCCASGTLSSTPARGGGVSARLTRARDAAKLALESAGTEGAGGVICLVHRSGFWSYSVCSGGSANAPARVRQFHVEVGPGGTSRISTDIVLGEHQVDRDELLLDDHGSVVLRQNFGAGGTDGRSAAVDWLCEAPAVGSTGAAPAVPAALVSVHEDVAARQYVLTVAARGAALCTALPSVAAAMASINGTCARHVAGWWTYDVCLGGKAMQYHATSTQDASATAAVGKARVQESLLGTYDVRMSDAVDVDMPGSPRAIIQHFVGGTPCVTGRARETTVRLSCPPGGAEASLPAAIVRAATWEISSVEEPAACAYIVHATSAAVCSHLSLEEARDEEDTRVRIVDCRRLASVDGDGDGDGVGK